MGFIIGASLFGGSIYLAALFDELAFTLLTPIGETMLMASWLGLVATGVSAAFKAAPRE